MKIYLKGRENQFDAKGVISKDGKVTVLKGSRVKEVYSEKIPSEAVKARNNTKMKEFIIDEDIVFESASTAAAFVTGNSTNGLRAWKTEKREELGKVIAGKGKKPKKGDD
jgi:hypothetical protein